MRLLHLVPSAIVLLAAVVVNISTTGAADDPLVAEVKALAAKFSANRTHAIDEALAGHGRLVKILMLIADPDEPLVTDKEAKEAAAVALRSLGARQAVDVLARGFEKWHKPVGLRFKPSAYDTPFFDALVEIGRPSVPAFLKVIAESERDVVRSESVAGLYYILGGCGHVEVLEKALAEAKTDVIRERFQQAVARAKARVKRLEENK